MVFTIRTKNDGLQLIGIAITLSGLIFAVFDKSILSIFLLVIGTYLFSIGLREYTNGNKTQKGKAFWGPTFLFFSCISLLFAFTGSDSNNFLIYFLITFAVLLNHLFIDTMFRQFRIPNKTKKLLWYVFLVILINVMTILTFIRLGSNTTYSGTPDWLVGLTMVNLLILAVTIIIKIFRWGSKLFSKIFTALGNKAE